MKFGMFFSFFFFLKNFEKKKERKDKFFARIKGSIKYSRYDGYLQFRIHKRNRGELTSGFVTYTFLAT